MKDGVVNIRALAELARLAVTDEEVARLEREIPEILAFVETIRSAGASVDTATPALRNVLRADENPHEGGIYTESLLSAAPARVGNRVVVRQVISRRKKSTGEK